VNLHPSHRDALRSRLHGKWIKTVYLQINQLVYHVYWECNWWAATVRISCFHQAKLRQTHISVVLTPSVEVRKSNGPGHLIHVLTSSVAHLEEYPGGNTHTHTHTFIWAKSYSHLGSLVSGQRSCVTKHDCISPFALQRSLRFLIRTCISQPL